MIDERLYRERIIEPAIQAYKDAVYLLKYSPAEADELIEKKIKKMSKGNHTVIPALCPFCFASCTLNCKHCSMLIPRINHFSTEFAFVKSRTDRILDQIDEVVRYSPGSGEILLHNDLEKLLEYALDSPKIFMVDIFTNATIIPRDSLIPLMQHPKFLLYVSDYGNLRQQAALLEFCEKNRINVHMHELVQWFPLDIRTHNRTKEELISQFSRCFQGKNCKSLYDGRLYHCGQMAAMVASGLLKPDSDNSMEITDELCGGDYARFTAGEYSKACDMCGFGIENTPTVPAGEQHGRYSDRSEYIIVPRKELAESRAWLKELTEGKNWLETQYFNYKALYEDLINKK